MKRRAGEVKRPTKLNKIASQVSLGIVRKPLPVWVIDAIDIHGIRKHSQNTKETIDANVLKM